MAAENFVEHVLDLMAPLGEVAERKMFGGHGFFSDGRMFAMISRDGSLYLRVDDMTRDTYVSADLPQFRGMPYFAAPPEALEDRDVMTSWASEAQAAAARAKPSSKKPSSKKPSSKKPSSKKKASKKKVSKKPSSKKKA